MVIESVQSIMSFLSKIFKSREQKLKAIDQELERLNYFRARGGSIWINARRLNLNELNQLISAFEARRKKLSPRQKTA